ncbi:MAG: adenylosuccinate synthetase [Chitinophagales bacterium]|nr:adenylosuccinate synthetase [Chitinophagales bacterium]
MKTAIVLGLGFGDEGKGVTTNFLCRQSRRSLVIRFSGGHQAGHTVVMEDGRRHVFSSIGSGAFQQTPTYWSRYCTFHPTNFLQEWKAIHSLGIVPKVFVDACCPVTTPYDVYFNQLTERANQHGSCGLGFGATIRRTLSPYKLYVQDLAYPQVLHQKLKAIGKYYEDLGKGVFAAKSLRDLVQQFREDAKEVLARIEVVHEQAFLQNVSYEQLIFEGSQGILLDMDHGFFPNVTFAHTTSRNAMELIQHYQLPIPEVYYVTRAYQTRHGNGFLSNEGMLPNFIPNPAETNQYNQWQGYQRVSLLDIDMLRYALQSDANYIQATQKHLVVTCLDQLQGVLQATLDGKVIRFPQIEDLAPQLMWIDGQLIECHSECGPQQLVKKKEYAV